MTARSVLRRRTLTARKSCLYDGALVKMFTKRTIMFLLTVELMECYISSCACWLYDQYVFYRSQQKEPCLIEHKLAMVINLKVVPWSLLYIHYCTTLSSGFRKVAVAVYICENTILSNAVHILN